MHIILQNLNAIKNKVNEIVNKKQLKTSPRIIAVTKTFSSEKFIDLLDSGHKDFGENKVQETENKWPSLRKNYDDLKLHMVGKLQTNKAKKAVELFDYIHSLDNIKLAKKIDFYEKELQKKLELFIQVNIGDENQKSGILLKDVSDFYNFCTKNLSLNIIGLMCLPPVNAQSSNYFTLLKKKADELNLKNLSMGMSSDYEDAVSEGSTYLRLGTAILGSRNI